MDLKKLLISLFLFASLNLYAGATPWQDIEIDNGLLLIDVEIGGIPAKAMLDTGAQTLALNVDFLEKNQVSYKKGSKVTLQGVFGERRANLIKNLNVKMFGSDFPIKRALPFEGDGDIAMIVGLPFFKNFIFQIDYPQQRLKLITRDSLDLKDFRVFPNPVKDVLNVASTNKKIFALSVYGMDGRLVKQKHIYYHHS